MRLRVCVNGDPLVHGKSGQHLQGACDFRCEEGYRQWLDGQVERGAVTLPTKATLRRQDPDRDLTAYGNPEGDPESDTPETDSLLDTLDWEQEKGEDPGALAAPLILEDRGIHDADELIALGLAVEEDAPLGEPFREGNG